jgi:hypothetical protein
MFTNQCPACGLSKTEWAANRSEGYALDGLVYCCRECAEDMGCRCREAAAMRNKRRHYRQRQRF